MAADFLLFCVIADNKIQYLFSFQSFIFYLSNVPTVMVRLKLITDVEVKQTYYLYTWKIFRLFSIMRIIKVLRKNPMARIWFRLMYKIFLVVLVFCALFATVEN